MSQALALTEIFQAWISNAVMALQTAPTSGIQQAIIFSAAIIGGLAILHGAYLACAYASGPHLRKGAACVSGGVLMVIIAHATLGPIGSGGMPITLSEGDKMLTSFLVVSVLLILLSRPRKESYEQ